jgi:diadenosine tetraphosphatase ApaH/serine/threonine PP2A family protein phosphatase
LGSSSGTSTLRLAAIADVHGNRWALEAVLEDLERWRQGGGDLRGEMQVVDLGDTVFGPLAPAETAGLLMDLGAVTVRGNQDRATVGPTPEEAASPTGRHVREALSDGHLAWIRELPVTRRVGNGAVLLCHGTPGRDDTPLLDEIGPRSVALAGPDLVRNRLGAAARDGVELVLCGHTHVPRMMALPDGPLVVNPGSVGLPAYTHDAPFPHAMEAGSPHARYALLERREKGWMVEHRAVPYDWRTAADTARRNGRADWARWLSTGRGL